MALVGWKNELILGKYLIISLHAAYGTITKLSSNVYSVEAVFLVFLNKFTIYKCTAMKGTYLRQYKA